jgi:hypothetical protein
MYLRVPGLYCILLELAIPSTHTQVSREEVKEETVWKYIYDLLKIIGSIVVPFPVCTFTFFFWQKLFCEMLGHRKKYKKNKK